MSAAPKWFAMGMIGADPPRVWVYHGTVVMAVLVDGQIVRVRHQTADRVEWLTPKVTHDPIDCEKRGWSKIVQQVIDDTRNGRK